MKTWQEHVEAAEDLLDTPDRTPGKDEIAAVNAHTALAATIVAGTAMDKAMEDL